MMAGPEIAAPALDSIRAAIRSNHLSGIPEECLDFAREESLPPMVSYAVREHHGESCPGDPATSPRLFSVAADTVTWALSTDAGSPTGTMRPLTRTSK